MQIKKNLLVSLVFVLTLSTVPFGALAQEGNSSNQPPFEGRGSGSMERSAPGEFRRPQEQRERGGMRKPEGESGEDMGHEERGDKKEDVSSICKEAFMKAETEMKDMLSAQNKEQKKANRENAKKNRIARFELEQKYAKMIFDAETKFMDAAAAAEDSGDKTSLKTLREQFNTTKRTLLQEKAKALKELAAQNPAPKKEDQGKAREAMQEKIKTLPAECQEVITNKMPKNDSQVKGAFIRAIKLLGK